MEPRRGSGGRRLAIVVDVGRTAPTRRMTEASLGKMPTTRARRLISLLSRSSGLVDQILDQWARGNAGRRGLGFGVVHQRDDLGNRSPSWSRTGPGGGDGVGIGLGEDGAEHGGDHVLVALGDEGKQVAGEVDAASLMDGAGTPAQGGDEAGVLVGDDQPTPPGPRLARS